VNAQVMKIFAEHDERTEAPGWVDKLTEPQHADGAPIKGEAREPSSGSRAATLDDFGDMLGQIC
jgi:hypothetical protein